MCRLFGMLSMNATNAWKYLLEDPCSLYVQSKIDPERLQSDGWGIGFYVNGVSHLIKSERPIYTEYEKFASAVQGVNSRIILAHIRRASNPRGLPREKIISSENSQPFKYENYIFVHNGTINIPDEVAESLGEWKQKIRGFNDSEVYFWYIMKEMTDGASFSRAIKSFERTLLDLWQKNREKHPSKNRPYIGLNIVLGDGERLYAYCKYDEMDEPVESLCLKDQPVLKMSYLINPTSLVVASEKTNRKDNWQPLKTGSILTGEVKEEKISVKSEEI